MKPAKSLIGLLIMTLSLVEAEAQKLNLLIGTYTKTGKSEGIYVYEFDTKTGKTSYKNKAIGLENPSYLAISKNGKYVYAVNEAGPGKGAVNSFSFDKKTGKLSLINSAPSGGNGPCYISVDDKNQHIFVANYGGGSFSAVPLNKNGSFTDAIQTFAFKGSSVNQQRQEASHVHSAVLSPDNSHLFVSDLGTDKINIYKYDASTVDSPLVSAEQAFFITEPGSGPRHFEFHPNGKFAYSIQELNGNVSAFTYKEGKLELIQNISGLPANYKGRIWSADIHISPDGKFLYSSNRDDLNDLAIFRIDESTGKLSFAGRQATLGKAPRNFVIDPTGNFLLAANQNSDTIVIFKRDKKTGLLTDTGERIEIGSPVCLKFTGN